LFAKELGRDCAEYLIPYEPTKNLWIKTQSYDGGQISKVLIGSVESEKLVVRGYKEGTKYILESVDQARLKQIAEEVMATEKVVIVTEDILKAFKKRLEARIANVSDEFTLIYTDDELATLIGKGKELGLANDVIDDLLYIGCRNAKNISATDLATQMDNLVNRVLKDGLPYRFTDKKQFIAFAEDLKSGLNDIGVSTSDVRLQGSCLRTPNAKDVDMVTIISVDEFDNIIKKAYDGKIKKNKVVVDIKNMTSSELKNLSDDIIQNPSLYNDKAKGGFNYCYTSQMINAKPDKGIIKGLKELKESLQAKYPNLNIENIAIQTSGGTFDLKPFMKL